MKKGSMLIRIIVYDEWFDEYEIWKVYSSIKWDKKSTYFPYNVHYGKIAVSYL